MKITVKTFSARVKLYEKTSERSYLLKFLIPVMVVINYLTMMLVIVVIC